MSMREYEQIGASDKLKMRQGHMKTQRFPSLHLSKHYGHVPHTGFLAVVHDKDVEVSKPLGLEPKFDTHH
jgi:hypothetical protein